MKKKIKSTKRKPASAPKARKAASAGKQPAKRVYVPSKEAHRALRALEHFLHYLHEWIGDQPPAAMLCFLRAGKAALSMADTHDVPPMKLALLIHKLENYKPSGRNRTADLPQAVAASAGDDDVD